MEAKYIHRELSSVLEEAYRYFSVITVTGPRQSGKTTLIRNLFPHLPYYSLESLDIRSFAENDPIATIKNAIFLYILIISILEANSTQKRTGKSPRSKTPMYGF